jgi:hypothetical protein
VVVVVDDAVGGAVVGTGGTLVDSVDDSVDGSVDGSVGGSVEDVTSPPGVPVCAPEVPSSLRGGVVGPVVVPRPDDNEPVAPAAGVVVRGATGAPCPSVAWCCLVRTESWRWWAVAVRSAMSEASRRCSACAAITDGGVAGEADAAAVPTPVATPPTASAATTRLLRGSVTAGRSLWNDRS